MTMHRKSWVLHVQQLELLHERQISGTTKNWDENSQTNEFNTCSVRGILSQMSFSGHFVVLSKTGRRLQVEADWSGNPAYLRNLRALSSFLQFSEPYYLMAKWNNVRSTLNLELVTELFLLGKTFFCLMLKAQHQPKSCSSQQNAEIFKTTDLRSSVRVVASLLTRLTKPLTFMSQESSFEFRDKDFSLYPSTKEKPTPFFDSLPTVRCGTCGPWVTSCVNSQSTDVIFHMKLNRERNRERDWSCRAVSINPEIKIAWLANRVWAYFAVQFKQDQPAPIQRNIW